MSSGSHVENALEHVQQAAKLLNDLTNVETAKEHLQKATETLNEQSADESDPFIYTSNAPMDGRCQVCDQGPLPWVANLRGMEVTQAQRTDEWFEARKKCVTASELASVLGQNPYCSKIQTLRRKLGQTDEFTSFACQHGNDNEDRAIALYEKKTGHRVMPFGLLRSQLPGQTHLAGSPDGITHCGRLVEVKCPVTRLILPGTVPKHYRAQIELLMHLTGISVADFVQMGVAQGVIDITACPSTPMYYETIRAKVDEFVVLMNKAKGDHTILDKYKRKRAPRKINPAKTFEAGFILEE